MKNILYFIILGLFLISFASAENIGNFPINTNFQITNYCSTADCTYMNLTSITTPKGQVIYYNSIMTKNLQEFNFTYNATEFGVYNFKTCADPENTQRCENDSFTISKFGEDLTIELALTYLGLICFLFFLFMMSLYGIFKFENFIGIFIMFWVSYLLLFTVTFICYQVTDSYVINVEFLGNFFWIVYWIMLIAIVPLFLASMVYLFYIITYNEHFKKLVEKGMSPEEAFQFNEKTLNPFKNNDRR